MKKIIVIIATLLLVAGLAPVQADDRPIAVTELPAAARQFLDTHFGDMQVAYATVDGHLFDKDYEVAFTNGSKVEFDRNGEWKEVEVRTGSIPAAIIPQQIRQYINQNYPDTPVRQIDRDRRGYEVKLVNGLELEFNNNLALIKIDY